MKSLKMSWTWLPRTGNRKIFGRVNPLGELMEAETQQIKHWDGLEFAKTNTWTFPDYVLASQGMWSHQSVLWVVAEDSGPTPSCRTAERKSPVNCSLAFALSQKGLCSIICVNKLLQWRWKFIPAEELLLQLKPIPQTSRDCTGKSMFSSASVCASDFRRVEQVWGEWYKDPSTERELRKSTVFCKLDWVASPDWTHHLEKTNMQRLLHRDFCIPQHFWLCKKRDPILPSTQGSFWEAQTFFLPESWAEIGLYFWVNALGG